MAGKATSVDVELPQEAGQAPSGRAWNPRQWTSWATTHHRITALAAYAVFTLALTFPLILHLGDSIMGPVVYGDSMWYTWYPYAFRQALLAGQDPAYTHLLYALLPRIQLFAASYINGAVGALLLSFMVPLAVFNVLELSTFIIGGFTTYLLVNEFVPRRWVAFIVGCMYTFSTYHFWRVISGLSPTSATAWMPLTAWLVFAFYRHPTWRNAIFMGLSIALLPLLDLYTAAYFLPIFGLVFIAGLLIGNRAWLARPKHLVRAAVGLALSAAITLPPLASSLTTTSDIRAAIALKNADPGTNAAHYAANIFSYFFPSPRNPVFGHFTARLYQHIPAGVSEETAGYLGMVALALAVFGFLVTRPRTRAMYFWVVMGIAAFVVSLGPYLTVGGHRLFPLPFYGWIYDWPILSSFRAPNRMAPVVLLAVCVLAAYGLAALFDRVQAYAASRSTSPRVPRAAVVAVGVLVICASLTENIQFAFPYPFAYVPVPAVYYQMAADPVPGLVLTLPVLGEGLDMYYQTIYQRGLVEGRPIRESYTMIRTFENIPEVSLLDRYDGNVAGDAHADTDGELHDVFPLQETMLQGLQENHIRYVVLRSDTTGFTGKVFPPIQPWMKPFLEQQLGMPFYNNAAEGLTVWRIPPGALDPNVTRFRMGAGWMPGLKVVKGTVARGILDDGELDVYVPRATTEHLSLTALSHGLPRSMAVSVNGKVVATIDFTQPNQFQTTDLGTVTLHAGENVLHFAATRACVDPGATFPATLDAQCLLFQVAALHMDAVQA
jgi:hypothetical protein